MEIFHIISVNTNGCQVGSSNSMAQLRKNRSLLFLYLDFSNSHCALCQPISVPMPKVFNHRGSLEDDFPEVQSSWNVKNNFPNKLYSHGSVPLSLLCHSLVTQMKEEEGGMETTTVPQQHTVCLPIAVPFRVVLVLLNLQCANTMCFWSGMLREGMWQSTSGQDAFC